MKKVVCIFISFALFLSVLSGCSKNDKKQSGTVESSEDVIVEEIVIDKTSSVSSKNSGTTVTSESKTSSQAKPSTNTVTSKPNSKDEKPISSKQESTSSNIKPSKCSHIYDDVKIQKTAKFFEAGEKKYTCTNCGDSYTNTYPIEKIKILAIGNSFSLNSMWNLYDVLKAAGVKNIDIAIMYIGGCSLDKHWEGAQNNSTEYQLYRNNSGEWKITPDYTLETILKEGGWDIITLQQKSEHAGDDTKFSNLDNMINYVTAKCPDATLLWNMTWAFTNDSKYMPNQHIYNYDDITMYEKIAECTQSTVAQNKKIHSIVPTGTAVMNARTSRVKDDVHLDDGSHLSEDIGYYVAAFTWFIHITGMSPYDFGYRIPNPSINENIDIFVESAENAIENPYKITQSYYTR